MRKLKFVIALMMLLSYALTPLAGFADENDKKEAAAKASNAKVEKEIGAKLDEINKLMATTAKIQSDIDSMTRESAELSGKIDESNASITRTKGAIGDQLRSRQVNSSRTNLLTLLMSSNSLSEAISAAYSFSTIRHQEQKNISDLNAEVTNLNTMKTQVEDNKKTTESDLAEMKKKDAAATSELAELRKVIKNNQDLLLQVAKSRADAAAAKAKAEADAKAKEDAAKAAAAKKPAAPAKPSAPAPAPVPDQGGPTPPEGDPKMTMTMSATAYSTEAPGMGNYGSAGVYLVGNNHAIAVDPSVIPLLSICWVSGYGYCVAADTGGGIKGNLIDVHFAHNSSALAWGRKTVEVKVW